MERQSAESPGTIGLLRKHLRLERILPVLLWALPLLAGFGLRIYGLPYQVLGGDEFHAPRAVLRIDFPDILATYQKADHSIPLSTFYKAILRLGASGSEIQLRAPLVASGIAAIIFVPFAARTRIGPAASYLFSWLLAFSPLLVLYSRVIRSYAIITFLAPLSVLLYYSWHETRDKKYAAAYLILGASSIYFHLLAVPFVLVPLLFSIINDATDRRRMRDCLRSSCVLAVVMILVLSTFLVPAYDTLRPLVDQKRLPPKITFGMLWTASQEIAGTGHPLAASLFWAAALSGLYLVLRTDRRFGLFVATVLFGHILGLRILAPKGLGHSLIFTRYLLIIVPFVILLVAVGLAHFLKLFQRWRCAPTFVAMSLVAGALAAGPLLKPEFMTSSFTHHNDFILFICPQATAPVERIPEFYESFRDDQRPGAVIEVPWDVRFWPFIRAPYVYQQVHERPVVIGVAGEGELLDRMELQSLVRLGPRFFLEKDARFLVVHRDPMAEERFLRKGRCPRTPVNLDPSATKARLQRQGTLLERQLRSKWGPPDFKDELAVAWDLDQVRPYRAVQNDQSGRY